MQYLPGEIPLPVDDAVSPKMRTRAAIAAGAGIFVGTYDLAAVSLALPSMMRVWHGSGAYLGVLGSASLAGTIMGAVAAGFLADRFGRRGLLLLDFFTYLVAALGSALAPTAALWVAFRIMVGVGIGADFAVAFPYLAEATGDRTAGNRLMAWSMWAANFGMLLAYLLGAFTVSAPHGWRILLAIGALFAVGVLATRAWLPESALWLRHHRTSMREIVRETVSSGNLPRVATAAVNWFSYQVGDQGLTLFLPLLLMGMLRIPAAQAAWGSVMVKAVTIPAAGFTIWAITRWGPGPLQVGGFLVRSLALIGLGMVLALRDHVAWAVPIEVTLLVMAYAAGAAGPDKTTVIIPAQQFATPIRASGQAMAEGFGRIGGVVGTIGYAWILSLAGPGPAVAFLGAAAAVGCFVSVLSHATRERLPALQDVGEGVG